MSDNGSLAESNNLPDVPSGYLGPTPPPGPPPLKGERLWVDRPEQLAHAVEILKRFEVVAIDAEFTQARPRSQNVPASTVPRLALLQLAVEGHCFVVDTLRLQDLSPLLTVVCNPDIVVLLHGAGADIRVMAARGLYVMHYYDLEATCRSIFGQHESSLAAMLQRAFNFHLDKSLQRTDWTRRPLPSAMIAYAARDAEVTLALYHWLEQHYHDILQLHEYTEQPDPVAAWIEPFLRGVSPLSAEMAVTEAREHGLLANRAQLYAECRQALAAVRHPMRRSRLLRLIADLSLAQLAPDILPLLHAATSDERSAAARALGRLGVDSTRDEVALLLQDPVQDVRKAAALALRNLDERGLRQPRTPTKRAADGTRSWVVGTDEKAQATDNQDDWKARLRSMMDL